MIQPHTDDQILELMNSSTTMNQGFKLLMDQHQERLYWHIRRMVLDHESTNDILQNTFIKVFKGFRNFKGNAKLYTWLYRIATNETMTFLQKNQRHRSTTIDDEIIQLKADPYFETSQIEERLIRAIATLPTKQSAVFQLRYYDDLSYREISEILETSEGALKASYHHAVKKIETFFNEKE